MTPVILTRFQAGISEAWQRTIERLIEQASPDTQFRSEATQILIDYTNKPGKFVRPGLFLTGYTLLADRETSEEIVKLSMSFELLHLALLIQDDIMDASDIRRNGPSLHRRFETFHREKNLKGDAEPYGINMAILLSDILTNEAESLWTQAIIKKIIHPELRIKFDELKNELYWGQYDDIALPAHSDRPDLEAILAIAKNKSGAYSIYRPLQVGVLAAGHNDELWLSEFCLNLGVAFQLTDDILGMYGDPDTTGKSADSDLNERKFTALVYFAYSLADEKNKKILNQWFVERESDEELRRQCHEIFTHYPVKEKTFSLAEDFHEKSLKALNGSPLNPDKKALLQSFAEFIIKREK